MKQFLLKISVFSILVLSSILGVFSLADGSTDAMYLKFTTGEQQSMIIGSSRAAQGLQPNTLNPLLDGKQIFNYAFQIPSSPYGQVYLNSIKKKLAQGTKDGLFILEVNPWTIGYRIDAFGNEYLSEIDGFLDKTSNVSMNPNVEYLIESYNGGYYNIIRDKNRKGSYQTLFVEPDGWLHVTIESDAISRSDRTAIKLKSYRNKLKKYQGISPYRLASLKETITYLKQQKQ